MSRECDYDLNIFQQEVGTYNQDTGETEYDYAGPWYIDIYDVYGSGHQHVAGPYELTKQEARLLDLGNGYFDEGDCWYGLDGFLKDYEDYISERMLDVFNSLPRHAEEVLF